ncbi:hypothetical protein Tco_0906960 [Tanacetum coccineum]|uniref:Transposase (Putative), gypsy type n=1 Tax=Tanacetum coccineum TaxID=301880 RepID=A0ABQ5CHY4_9ASTR
MGTIDSIKSILTQSALDALCEKYHIPNTVHPELPGPNARIRNSPTSKIGIYSRFFDFANYRIPLSQFLVDVDSSVFPFVVLWHTNKTLRKDPHPTPNEFDANVCDYLADNPAPFRKLPEPFLCFVGISRYYDLDKTYYPTFWDDEDEEMDLFAFIHHANPTKVRIGEREVREGEGAGNDNANEGGDDAVVADQAEQGDHVVNVEGIDIVVDDEIQAIVTDQPKKVRKKRKAADAASVLLDSSTLAVEVGVTTATTVPFVTSSVTPTLEREGGGYTDYITGPNLQTQKPAKRFVISSDSPHNSNANVADDEVTSVVRSSILDPAILTTAVATTVVADTFAPVPRAELSAGSFYVSQDMDSEALRQIYIPKWNVVNDFTLDDPEIC